MCLRDVQYKLDSVLLEQISLRLPTSAQVTSWKATQKNPVLNNYKLLNINVHQTTNFQLIPAAQHCTVFP